MDSAVEGSVRSIFLSHATGEFLDNSNGHCEPREEKASREGYSTLRKENQEAWSIDERMKGWMGEWMNE